MRKNELEGLPVIDADETEEITVAVRAGDMQDGDPKDPERHPIAIALRRQAGVDDARVTKRETLIRRGNSGSALSHRTSDCLRNYRRR